MKNTIPALLVLLLTIGCMGGKKDAPVVAEPEDEEEPLPERFESDDLPKAADELFDDFFYYYVGNSSLQHRRTVFPLPVTDADGKKSMVEDSLWTVNRFFMDQGLYVRIFDTQEQTALPGDTAVDHVVVEQVFFEMDSVRQYLFMRNEGRWMLTSVTHQALQSNPNAQFLHFYHDFATDSVFQQKSLSNEIAFAGPDPDDDFATMEGFITPDSWEAFAPELPRDSIYNIVYGPQSSRAKEKTFVICGIANGLETALTFRQKRGRWKLIRIEN
ncbi:MAG: DUF4348 domain-containing protein [Prevotella sp.]|nr:DUF4348 domain-containing protein [Prevotella sp.]